jgi:hypothetical protein
MKRLFLLIVIIILVLGSNIAQSEVLRWHRSRGKGVSFEIYDLLCAYFFWPMDAYWGNR